MFTFRPVFEPFLCIRLFPSAQMGAPKKRGFRPCTLNPVITIEEMVSFDIHTEPIRRGLGGRKRLAGGSRANPGRSPGRVDPGPW